MTNIETMLTARQVKEKLNVSAQMSGIYFREFEKVTNTKIKTVGRTGRSFSPEQVQVLLMARNIVQSDSTVTVAGAMQRAVGVSKTPLENVKPIDSSGISLDSLRTLLSESQEDLILEVRSLKEEVKGLRAEVPNSKTSTPPEIIKKTDAATEHGLIVRTAIWVESLLKRLR
jgi:hypothetical protein